MRGKLAPIRRWQIHKMRNVLEHVPPSMQGTVRQGIGQAYRIRDVEKAKNLLKYLAVKFDTDHSGSANPLKEGLDETLTVMGLGLLETLEMILRCSAPGHVEVEKEFRKI